MGGLRDGLLAKDVAKHEKKKKIKQPRVRRGALRRKKKQKTKKLQKRCAVFPKQRSCLLSIASSPASPLPPPTGAMSLQPLERLRDKAKLNPRVFFDLTLAGKPRQSAQRSMRRE